MGVKKVGGKKNQKLKKKGIKKVWVKKNGLFFNRKKRDSFQSRKIWKNFGSKFWGKHSTRECIFCWVVGGWVVYFFSSTLRFWAVHIPELREIKPRSARKEYYLHSYKQFFYGKVALKPFIKGFSCLARAVFFSDSGKPCSVCVKTTVLWRFIW